MKKNIISNTENEDFLLSNDIYILENECNLSIAEIDAFLQEERTEKEVLEKLKFITKLFKLHAYKGTNDDVLLLHILFRFASKTESLSAQVIVALIIIVENKETIINSLPINDIVALTTTLLGSDSPTISFFALQLAAFLTKKEEFVHIVFEAVDFAFIFSLIQEDNLKNYKYVYWALNYICNIFFYKQDFEEEVISSLFESIINIFQTKNEKLISISLDIIVNITKEETYRSKVDECGLTSFIISFITPKYPKIARASIIIINNLFESGECLDSDAIASILFNTLKFSINLQVLAINATKTFLSQCKESIFVLAEIGLFDIINELFQRGNYIVNVAIIKLITSIADTEEICEYLLENIFFIDQILEKIQNESEEIVVSVINILCVFISIQEKKYGMSELKEKLQESKDIIEEYLSSQSIEISEKAEELYEIINSEDA